MPAASRGRPTFGELGQFYRDHLLTQVMPFWLRHGLDREHGGVFTGLADDGTLQTTDKFIWSNARAIYTFAALYNHIEHDERWLEAARQVCGFCLDHGREPNGAWAYRTDRAGKLLEGEKAIQVDAFAIMGLVEYARATGEQRAIDAALATFESSRSRLERPGSYGTFPYPIPEGAKAHRDYFQFALAYFELAVLLDRGDILAAALERADEVMDNFRRADRQVLLEYVGRDNRPLDSPAGRAMVPGHAIEAMWFMIHVYRHVGRTERIAEAVETIRWGLERGWDDRYGGILLGVDVDGRSPPYWNHADKKLWWVHAEALYALLLAHEQTAAPWCLQWYWRVHDWSFAHFPVPAHGEWYNRLERDGTPTDTVVALPVKDPFHLPRALVLCIDVLERLAS